jgi:hypothetical protein
MPDRDTVRVSCAWCHARLAADDAKPVKYARLHGVSDDRNMQCRDTAACQRRQVELDADRDARMGAVGLDHLFGVAS